MEVDRFFLQLLGSLFYLGDDGDVTYQVRQAKGLHIGPVYEHVLPLLGYSRTCYERLQIASYAADRRAEFVGDIVGHLLFHHLAFLGFGNVVDSYLETVVRINEHLYTVVMPALGKLEVEHRCGIILDRSVPFQKFQKRRKDAALPYVVQIRRRPVKQSVDILDKTRVCILFLPVRGENRDASVIIMYMQKEPLFFKRDHVVAVLEHLVALEHLLSDLPEFRVGEGNIFIVHVSLDGGFGEIAQFRNPLPEMVGQEDQRKEGNRKKREDKYQEQRIRPKETLYIQLIRQGEPYYVAAV